VTSQSDAVIGFDRETYQQAFSEIESLAGRLPKLAVANLAREVVTQLAARLPQFATGDHVPSAEEIDRICFALMEADHTAAARMIEHIRAEGATLERIYLSYLSAAAKRLGEMWASDQASFLEVTIGSARIYAILNTMRVAIARPVKLQRRSAVFALVPGEDHSLGVRMAYRSAHGAVA
jgi:methanogenic corrinoid protein MtbC1